MNVSVILAMVLSLSVHDQGKEDSDAYRKRMITTSQAIEAASEAHPLNGSPPKMAALLATIAHYESGYDRDVHAGNCPKNGCDGGKSATMWQIMWGSWLPRSKWVTFIGLEREPTTRAATYAANVLRRGYAMCGSVRGAISIYATGRTCYWSGAKEREKTYFRVLGR